MTEPRRGYLGLGSNAGARLANLQAARDLLDRPVDTGIAVAASSSVFETEPQEGAVGQRDFLNTALAVETSLAPGPLLEACKRVERSVGRSPERATHAPRAIDVDVLLLGDLEVRSPALTLPHPDIARRRFVLVPLLELDPALALPDGTRLADLLERVEGQRVERLGPL